MTSNLQHLDDIPVAGGMTGSGRAAQLLSAPEALTGLRLEEASVVVRYMTPRFFPANTTFIREGDTGGSGFMALLIEGDVVVERVTVSRTAPVTIRVLGPGSLVGEIGLVDKEPRSASCTAATDVWCAILTREGIDDMIERDSKVAARLLLGVSANIAERLRDTNRQLKLYARLATAMREELTSVSTPAAAQPRSKDGAS
ncbi:MAG: cyclic nucleotide-binding domain-containing protein [Rhodoferax sp.]|nr:cyclic nucleotide-binding domain-containing protein [Rhodoferax sp.]